MEFQLAFFFFSLIFLQGFNDRVAMKVLKKIFTKAPSKIKQEKKSQVSRSLAFVKMRKLITL